MVVESGDIIVVVEEVYIRMVVNGSVKCDSN